MTPKPIITPRGTVSVNKAGKAELKWNTTFKDTWTKKFTKVQIYIDSEVLRLSEPYIPLKTGMLILSGILATRPGEGRVGWIAPYARKQYYMKRPVGTPTGPLRGPYWFFRMKATHLPAIYNGAKKIMKQESGQ